MKILNKLHKDKSRFKGWTHFYEDGLLIQNESSDEKYIANITLIAKENQMLFYIYLTNNTYDVIYEDYTTSFTLTNINGYLQSVDTHYKLTITIDEYFDLLHQETI